MGIDLGTSSLKIIVINEEGIVLGMASRAYQFSSPYNNYAEQDPQEWWENCVGAIHEIFSDGTIKAEEIKGISFSGQMHGLVSLDKNGQAVRPAILHCDARSGKQAEEIEELFGKEKIRELMMNPVYTGFLLPSLIWVRENEPECFERIHHVCLPKDYLKYRLSGEISSDYSDASATLAFDIKQGCWSEKILRQLEIPMEWFPDCYGTSEVAGRVCRKAADETGLKEGTLIIAGGGDQVMQGIGNGITGTGQASANIGTSGQISFQVDRAILNPSLNTNTFMGYKKNRWITMGAIMNAGLCYKWVNSLFADTDYDAMNEKISKVLPGSGGVIFLPYLNGERTPHLDPDLSGMFLGINLKTGRAQLARAVMEGVSFALYQSIEVCGSLGLKADSIIASGGGAKSLPWLQMQADIYNIPLKVADTEEQAGLGAAIAAGVGTGTYRDIEQGCDIVVKYKDFVAVPDQGRHRIYQEYYQLYKDTFQTCRENLHRVTLLGRKNQQEDEEHWKIVGTF